MKLSSLDQFLETVEYMRGGESLSITFDSNAFTSDFFRGFSSGMRRRLAEIEKEDKSAKKKMRSLRGVDRTLMLMDEEARAIEIEGDIYAELLSCDKGFVIKEWSATDDDGNSAPPTYENLQQLSPRALKEIFSFLRDYNRPKEQPGETILAKMTTSGTTEDGSQPEAKTQVVENQTM